MHHPPTDDAFAQHVLRARFQTLVWCQSHETSPNLPNPVGLGWKQNDVGGMEPVRYTKDAAPIEVRDLTHLYCNDKTCSGSGKCLCVSSGLPCTSFCSCDVSVCPNRQQNSLVSDEAFAMIAVTSIQCLL